MKITSINLNFEIFENSCALFGPSPASREVLKTRNISRGNLYYNTINKFNVFGFEKIDLILPFINCFMLIMCFVTSESQIPETIIFRFDVRSVHCSNADWKVWKAWQHASISFECEVVDVSRNYFMEINQSSDFTILENLRGFFELRRIAEKFEKTKASSWSAMRNLHCNTTNENNAFGFK